MLVYLFYAVPLLTVLVYGLNTPGCSWMLDWSVFFAGAVAQVRPIHGAASCSSSFGILPDALGGVIDFLPLFFPDPVVPHRGVSSLPHSVHVPNPIR